MEIFVVWKYVCIVVIVIAFKMVEDQTGAFNVDIVDAVGTTNLEKTELNFRRFGLSNLCTQKWI